MMNFQMYNPVNIVFGKDSILELPKLLNGKNHILFAYGKGSIKLNGVYNQVIKVLQNKNVTEFSGIEANPDYDTLMKCVDLCKKKQVDFILAVGGGSVIDGCKFIAHAVLFKGSNPWEIMSGLEMKEALPIGCVLTLPATGSEMNPFAVISRRSHGLKKDFVSQYSYPKFSILDPVVTFSLPKKQIINGIIDPFVHVTEQYLTYSTNAPLQERQSESILKTLIEEGPKALKRQKDYHIRANLMWCSTSALNGTIGKGVPQDWATHAIGHELTAAFDLDHAQTLAVVLPALLRHQFENKRKKLMHYGKVVWGLTGKSETKVARDSIDKTEEFFRALGAKTRLQEYKIARNALSTIASNVMKTSRGSKLGERASIGQIEVNEILNMAWPKA